MIRKMHLLIVDDELDKVPSGGRETRRALYAKLDKTFELSFLESPEELDISMDQHRFDAVLMDFVLEEWGVESRALIEAVRDRVPVVLISQSWPSNFQQLSTILSSLPIARLFTWDDMSTAESRAMVAFWIRTAVRNRRGILDLACGPNDPIRIVQFSDTQFNARDELLFEIDTQVAVQELQLRWKDPPQFIALPGDIAEGGRPSEYRMAEAWIAGIRKELERHPETINILTAPGNHDVCWPLALAARIDPRSKTLTNDDPIYPDIASYAFAPYREFSSRVEGATRWEGSRGYWVSGAYRSAGLILFGVNSSEDLDGWGMPSRRIAESTIAGLFADIVALKRDAPRALVVGLMHHPLEGSEQSIGNSSAFKRIIEATGSIVLLTGHVHEDVTSLRVDGKRPSILQIGSSTFTLGSKKRPEDSVRGFNVIELRREDDIVTEIEVNTFAIIGHQLKLIEATRYQHHTNGRLTLVTE